MLTEYSFTNARSHLTELIDRVQRQAPAVIKPRKKSEEPTVVLSRSLVHMLLEENPGVVRITPQFVEEPDGSITVSLDPMDIAVNAHTRHAAIHAACQEAIDYAKEYLSPQNAALYMRSPNRKDHLSIVIRTALSDSIDEVAEILNLA